MDWLLQPESWIALLTLTALEIVFSLDSVITLNGCREAGRLLSLIDFASNMVQLWLC